MRQPCHCHAVRKACRFLVSRKIRTNQATVAERSFFLSFFLQKVNVASIRGFPPSNFISLASFFPKSAKTWIYLQNESCDNRTVVFPFLLVERRRRFVASNFDSSCLFFPNYKKTWKIIFTKKKKERKERSIRPKSLSRKLITARKVGRDWTV